MHEVKADSGPQPIYTTLEINLVFAQNVAMLKLKPAVGYQKIPVKLEHVSTIVMLN